MTHDEATAIVEETLARLGIEAGGLGELAETRLRSMFPDVAGPALPRIALDGADLVTHGVLGRGGMGLVQLAEQRSLGRDVAVKSAVAGQPSIARALIREARITGSLEHPNVVPVHALGLDEAGAPLLVMKRVEGVSWRELLRDPENEAWAALLAGHGDRLRAHVEILVQVSRALAFAHDRGVVHRDLKPDNVMIGRFGEVYLLDWGIALKLEEREREPPSLVGTPAYLPPEMALGDPKRVDARTDVYLLGAALYEVLSGRLPNDAPTPAAALAIALSGARPPLPPTAPADLARLVHAAMATAPDARPQSAEAFRRELARFLASREAEVLVGAAAQARGEAERAIASEGATSPSAYRSLIEARFAASSAARLRHGDTRVRSELDACLGLLARRELALKSPVAAEAHLQEMSEVPTALAAELSRVKLQLDDERQVNEKARRGLADADLSPSGGLFVIASVAITGVFLASAIELLARAPRPSPADVLKLMGVVVGGVALTIVLARRWVLSNAAARQLTAIFVVWNTVGTVSAFAQLMRGVEHFDPLPAAVSQLVISAMLSLTLLPAVWPCIGVSLLGIAASLVWPDKDVMVLVAIIAVATPILIRAVWLRMKETRVSSPYQPER